MRRDLNIFHAPVCPYLARYQASAGTALKSGDQRMTLIQMPCTGSGNQLFALSADGEIWSVGLPSGTGRWIRNWGDLRGFIPNGRSSLVTSIVTGDVAGPKLFALVASNTIWTIGLDGGCWSHTFCPQPPFSARSFLGCAGGYLTALDEAGDAWIIGNIASGGKWVKRSNLNPPF